MPVGCACALNANVTDSIVPVNGNSPLQLEANFGLGDPSGVRH
jgi:hypothetical protein